MAGWRIRPYEAADRARVRHIVFQTGFMGDPVDWLWRDEDSFADLISAYYTDREPESALVALEDDTVVGFLLGCVDSRTVFGTAAEAHLGTFAENTGGIAFFGACGFRRHGPPLLVPGFRGRAGERMHVQWMVRSVEDERSTP